MALPMGVRATDQLDRSDPWRAMHVEPMEWRHTMAYRIQCLLCGKDTWSGNIVGLVVVGTIVAANPNGTADLVFGLGWIDVGYSLSPD